MSVAAASLTGGINSPSRAGRPEQVARSLASAGPDLHPSPRQPTVNSSKYSISGPLQSDWPQVTDQLRVAGVFALRLMLVVNPAN